MASTERYSEMAGEANHSRLTSMTHPSGFILTYNYLSGLNRSISRLSSLSDSSGTLESYDYLGLGTVVRRSHPQPAVDLTFLGTGPGSGGDQYVGLDSFNRVIDQNWKKGSSSTDRFTYTYDRDGNRLTKGNSVNTALNESYSYDNLNQLSSFTRGSHTQSWNFDSLGNWNSVTTDGSTQTRSHNKQNEITSVSGATTPTSDSNGNMTKDETGKQYVYDAWNRMKIVKDSGGTTLKTYGYDALNHRVSETVGSNTTDLYSSSGWQVLEERVNGTGKYRYVWSPVYVDAMILRDRLDATERIWVQQDANFNVTAITDGSGVVLERYAYDSYGKATVLNASWTAISGSAYAWQYLHQGGRLDTVSGLYHFRNRDYSPTLGRWVTMDPIVYRGGSVNLYGYVSQNPVNRHDSWGLADKADGNTDNESSGTKGNTSYWSKKCGCKDGDAKPALDVDHLYDNQFADIWKKAGISWDDPSMKCALVPNINSSLGSIMSNLTIKFPTVGMIPVVKDEKGAPLKVQPKNLEEWWNVTISACKRKVYARYYVCFDDNTKQGDCHDKSAAAVKNYSDDAKKDPQLTKTLQKEFEACLKQKGAI